MQCLYSYTVKVAEIHSSQVNKLQIKHQKSIVSELY